MKKVRPEFDRPDPGTHRTADDELGCKTMRGRENIDKKGHDPRHGDTPEGRKPTNGA
ncbi:MAG: hypothetical protein AAGL89_02580 [Pseudomonadota bacterium]